jgi:DHA2 family multidrug resistance protein
MPAIPSADKATLPTAVDRLILDDRPLIEVRHRGLLLAAIMMVAICQFFDATIANVALPHMRAAFGASAESISWVLTSFIIAGAIATPITGWLSDRIGSRNLFIGSTVAFLVASAACGASTSLVELVAFRAIQGLAAAFLGPLTQIIMFDISRPSQQASTMSTFGMLVMVAPISGPFVGGFLTEYLNWRWIYYVNLPLGIPALVIMWTLLPSRAIVRRRLDMFGFSALAMALGALQLLLDRGQHNDWFSSAETWVEAGVSFCGFWFFFVHTSFSAKPLFSRVLYADPNFIVGCAFMLVLGLTSVALSAILPTMYQEIYGYPVVFTGLLMAPRGLGVILTSLLTTRLMGRLDYRFLITIGYTIAAGSLWIMTTWSMDMDWHPIVLAGFVQGLGLGMVFAPMNMIAFGALSPALRPDGASLLGLFRNIGGSLGISIIVSLMAHNQQVSYSDLSAHITSLAPGAAALSPLAQYLPGQNVSGTGGDGLGTIQGVILRQSSMIAYLDNFKLIGWLLLAVAPIPFLLRKPRRIVMTGPMPIEGH